MSPPVALIITSIVTITTNHAVVLSPLVTVGICWLVLISHGAINLLGARFIAGLNQLNVWWTSAGLIVVTTTLLLVSKQLNTPEFVFFQYENYTGWSSESYVLMLGLLQGAYTLFGEWFGLVIV